MKIVLYVNSFLPSIGGREVVVHYLARELKNLGHDVRVVGASGWWKNRNLEFDYPVHRYPSLRGFFPRQVGFLKLLFDVWFYGADIINAHATFPAGYIAGRVKKIMKTPVVITPHGEDILKIPEIGFGDRMDPETNVKIEHTIREADRVSAISETIQAAVQEIIGDEEKVISIPNGIDNDRFERKVACNIHEKFELPADSKIILTVGNYHPRKGQEIIIRAMSDVSRRHPGARLMIVGRGTEVLKPLIHELGLERVVVLTGPIKFPFSSFLKKTLDDGKLPEEPDWLAAIYQNSMVYISGGINEGAEGLSLSLLDAMAAGLPVIATNISGNRDIVRNGENGFLVPPGKEKELALAVNSLLDDSDLLKKMSSCAIDDATPFSWKNIAKRYVNMYQSVCQCQK